MTALLEIDDEEILAVGLAFANNVSYVVGFRQLSIPLEAILSTIILKEAPHTPKIIGVAVMFIGLILVANRIILN